VNSVWVITSELVEIPNRAKWSQALSVTWSCSAVAGPLLGGIFSSTPCSPYPAYVTNLIESVSSKLFHFKLAMGMYVMISFQFGNPSFLTHASHSLSQPSHLLNWCSCTCAFTEWSRIRRSEGRLLERFASQVRFYRLVSNNGPPSRSYQVSNEDRLLFMGGTSCIIVGFSFASARGWGCESRYYPSFRQSYNAGIQGQHR
jgi:hypothetical protein